LIVGGAEEKAGHFDTTKTEGILSKVGPRKHGVRKQRERLNFKRSFLDTKEKCGIAIPTERSNHTTDLQRVGTEGAVGGLPGRSKSP